MSYIGSLHLSNGLPHGLGLLIDSKNNYTYIGNFDNGRRHGFGKMQTDSYTYIGEWSQNKRTGYGFYYTKSGYYIGDWNNDQKSGVGISQSKNLEIRAIWEDNKPYSICIVRKVGSQELKCALFVEEKIEYVSTDPNKLNHKFSSISVIKYLQQSKKILN